MDGEDAGLNAKQKAIRTGFLQRLREIAGHTSNANNELIELHPRNKFMGDRIFIEDYLPICCIRKGSHERELFLSGNLLGNASLKALSQVLARGNHVSLEKLSVVDNPYITDGGIVDLLSVLPQACPFLRKLYLHDIRIGDDALAIIAQTIPKMTAVTELSILPEHATDEGCSILADALQSFPPTFKALKLYELGDRVTPKGIRALVHGLRRARLTQFMADFDSHAGATHRLQNELSATGELIRNEFPCLIALCSVRMVDRLGRDSTLKMLPLEVFRTLASMLYKLSDLSDI